MTVHLYVHYLVFSNAVPPTTRFFRIYITMNTEFENYDYTKSSESACVQTKNMYTCKCTCKFFSVGTCSSASRKAH